MRYDEFRDHLIEALRNAGLHTGHGNACDTVDIMSMDRKWQVVAGPIEHKNTAPFSVSVAISFNWSSVNAARGQTCEEDVLTEMLGRRLRVPKTRRRLVRVDLQLHASPPYGSTAWMPDPQLLSSWSADLGKKLNSLLTDIQEREGQVIAVMGSCGDTKLEVHCQPEGRLTLTGVGVSAFQLVPIPRVWDEPDRRDAEKGNSKELIRLAQQFKTALEEWIRGIAELANWIRYSPPSSEAKSLEPWFEDEEEEDGPKIIH
jgi:hypothetical protein